LEIFATVFAVAGGTIALVALLLAASNDHDNIAF
jgi:hypothetical protein